MHKRELTCIIAEQHSCVLHMGALYVSMIQCVPHAADEARQQIGAGKLNPNLGSSHLLYEERSFMKI